MKKITQLRIIIKIFIKSGKIKKIVALKNSETPDFFQKASVLLHRWDGKTVSGALALNVDAISGATYSSRAIIGNVQRGLQYVEKNKNVLAQSGENNFPIKMMIGLLVVLISGIIPLVWKNKHFRTIQLILNFLVLGIWCGSFISYSLIINWLSSGLNFWISLIPIVMLITAFIYPLFGKKQYYCSNICPFGSAQELMGKVRFKKIFLPPRVIKYLKYFRLLLWFVLMILMVVGIYSSWINYELFTAFLFQSASWVVILFSVVFLLLSLFVSRPYCRFVCPTGTLIKISQKIW